MSKVDYIKNDALRFGDHVLQHTVSANNDFPEQAWADTLFMAAFVLLRVGVKLKDEDMINDALNQWYWHIKYLQNPETACIIMVTITLPRTICPAFTGEGQTRGQPTPCPRWEEGFRNAICIPGTWMWPAPSMSAFRAEGSADGKRSLENGPG